MIDLEPHWRDEITAILQRFAPHCEAWAFGAKAPGPAADYADLDLALIAEQPLRWEELDTIKDAFAESDLPIIVDVYDWRALSEESQQQISKAHEVLKHAEPVTEP